jgi:hypothetical protein
MVGTPTPFELLAPLADLVGERAFFLLLDDRGQI